MSTQYKLQQTRGPAEFCVCVLRGYEKEHLHHIGREREREQKIDS